MPLAGVDKKPLQQAKALQELGDQNMDIFVLNPNKTETKDGVKYVKYKSCKITPYIDYMFKHNFRRYSVLKHLPLDNYDYIILRYPKADASGIKFFKKYNVITEHHNNEYTELSLEAKYAKHLPYQLFKNFRAYLEKKYGKKILPHAKGIIGLSPDIVKYEQARSRSGIPTKAVGNGITVSDIPLTGFVPFDGKTLNIVLPTGHDLFFHGIDRIIQGAENYKGKVKIKLHLLGNHKNSRYTQSPNVTYHGVLYGDAYNNLMSRMNLGAGTLALHRLLAKQASALKTRDFTARGLPFIIAYEDTCLMQNPPEIPFFKNFPNDDSPIDFQEIIKFAEYISSSEIKDKISEYMRNYAQQHLDWKIIMQEYINFVKQIDAEKTNN